MDRRNRTKFIPPHLKMERVQTFVPLEVKEWVLEECRRCDRTETYFAYQAFLTYIHCYNWTVNNDKWVSLEELLWSPPYKNESGERADVERNQYKLECQIRKDYLHWLDSIPNRAKDYINNPDPDYLKKIKNIFSARTLGQIRKRPMHLKRALILYYKLHAINPRITEIDFSLLRVEGWTDTPNFRSTQYVLGIGSVVSSKLKELGIDLAKPPKIIVGINDGKDESKNG
jgi:hypothetical protein